MLDLANEHQSRSFGGWSKSAKIINVIELEELNFKINYCISVMGEELLSTVLHGWYILSMYVQVLI